MTNFETHPAGTTDLVKRLRSYQEFEQNRDGQIVCVKSEIANEAADRIEQLVAIVEQLEAALTRANAATAAAYDMAAMEAELWDGNILAYKIRALATPDQTAALDKLIAEAVEPYRLVLKDMVDSADEISSPLIEAQLLLAASKKGGV